MVNQTGDEFCITNDSSRPLFSVYIPFETLADASGDATTPVPLMHGFVQVPLQRIQRFRSFIAHFGEAVQRGVTDFESAAAQRAAEQKLVPEISALLSVPREADVTHGPRAVPRGPIIRRSMDFVEQHEGEYLSVEQLAAAAELKKPSGVGILADETIEVRELNLRRWILPRWGGVLVSQIKPLGIEEWFESLAAKVRVRDLEEKGLLKWPTISKLKSIMSIVFKHAQRHELIPASVDSNGRPTNPVLLARAKSDSEYEAVIVSPEQMVVILADLDTEDTTLEWTAALLIAATGLRAEEAFALQWHDMDWDKFLIQIRRCWSKGKITPGKTKLSMTQVAMHPALAEALQRWRRETVYGRDEDWVFPSKRKKGKAPVRREQRRRIICVRLPLRLA